MTAKRPVWTRRLLMPRLPAHGLHRSLNALMSGVRLASSRPAPALPDRGRGDGPDGCVPHALRVGPSQPNRRNCESDRPMGGGGPTKRTGTARRCRSDCCSGESVSDGAAIVLAFVLRRAVPCVSSRGEIAVGFQNQSSSGVSQSSFFFSFSYPYNAPFHTYQLSLRKITDLISQSIRNSALFFQSLFLGYPGSSVA